MTERHRLTRRSFLTDLGKGTAAVAILGVAGCSSGSATSAPSTPATDVAGSDPVERGTDETSAQGGSVEWERVNLGNVSAYVLARGSEITIVDTGVSGSEGELLNAVSALGGTWDSVAHVILTHSHGDHVGSLPAVLAAAPSATGYAGTADLDAISAPVDLTGLNDGDEVFGLEIIATPGHTPGHISVYDSETGLLVAGDALNTSNGEVFGANEKFTDDLALADESVKRLAMSPFETLLVGHGDPIRRGAGAAVEQLAATL